MKGEGFTLPWCDALSVIVGIIDISVVVAFVGCYLYLKIESSRANQEEDANITTVTVNQLPGTVNDHVEMTALNTMVNPFFSERKTENNGNSVVNSLDNANPMQTNAETNNKEKRNVRMKKVRRKLSIGARMKRKSKGGAMTGEVKQNDEKGRATTPPSVDLVA